MRAQRHQELTDKRSVRAPLWLLAGMFLLPAVQTAVAVYWQWHTAVSYPVLKAVMIALPAVIWWRWRRRGVSIRRRAGWQRTNLLTGLGTGALLGGIVLAGYYAVLRHWVDPAPVADKARSLGVLEHYWIMAVVISLWNSLLEEYYWRAFLIGELRQWCPSTLLLCLIGGGLFGLHHLFALMSAFAWPIVVLGVAGTMLAGVLWTWMRLRGASIFDCYLSHVLADLAVMWIGYDLILRAP